MTSHRLVVKLFSALAFRARPSITKHLMSSQTEALFEPLNVRYDNTGAKTRLGVLDQAFEVTLRGGKRLRQKKPCLWLNNDLPVTL